MTVETLRLISIILFILAGLLFAAAIALFFILKVNKSFMNLSGISAKRSIQKIREENQGRETGEQRITASPGRTAKIPTDKLVNGVNSPSSELTIQQRAGTARLDTAETAVLSQNQVKVPQAVPEGLRARPRTETVQNANFRPSPSLTEPAAPGLNPGGPLDAPTSGASAAIPESAPTAVLSQNQMPNPQEPETAVLSQNQIPNPQEPETAVLTQNQAVNPQEAETVALTPDQRPEAPKPSETSETVDLTGMRPAAASASKKPPADPAFTLEEVIEFSETTEVIS